MSDAKEKSCFVICPIGDPGTDARAWSDDIFFSLIQPIAKEYGYNARRAIDDARPGEITSNIVDDIISSDLVIADLTFHNANVFYELALRHAQGTPFFHVAQRGTKIPFDVAPINTVQIDRSTMRAVDETREELRRHFNALQNGTASFENPVKRYQQKLKADQTSDPTEKRVLALEEQVSELSRKQSLGSGEQRTMAGLFALGGDELESLGQDIDPGRPILAENLIGKRFRFTFNPNTGRTKYLSFNLDGTVGEGRNNNENTWKILRGFLVIYNSNGSPFSRFYMTATGMLRRTNDSMLPSIPGQYMIPLQQA